jgi:hypothetical protein
MNAEAATTATPDTTNNPEPFQELPEVFKGGVRIPHSCVYYDARDAAAAAAASPKPDDPGVEELDEEEVFEFEQPEGLEGRPGVSPLDRKTTRTHTVSKPIQLARESPRCAHIKPSGVRCGSPAMRGIDYCYYHKRTHVGPRLLYPTLMMLEDAHGVQAALMEVLCAILEGGLQPKVAGLLLYGLQTAACNLKRVVDVDPNEVATEEPEHDRPQDGIFQPEPSSRWEIEHRVGGPASSPATSRAATNCTAQEHAPAARYVGESPASTQEFARTTQERATREENADPSAPKRPRDDNREGSGDLGDLGDHVDLGDSSTVPPPSPERRVCRPG